MMKNLIEPENHLMDYNFAHDRVLCLKFGFLLIIRLQHIRLCLNHYNKL